MYAINNGIVQQLFVATTDMLQRSTMLMYCFPRGSVAFFLIFNPYCNRMLRANKNCVFAEF